MAFDGKERRLSRRSPQVGNVIYVNFGARDYTPVAGRDTFTDPDAPSYKPRRKTTRARATVKRTRSTAADWLTDLAFTQSDNGRMSRGRGYYQGGHVMNLEFVPGSITAKVIGSQPQPFSVAIMFPPRTDPQLARLPVNPVALSSDRKNKFHFRQNIIPGKIAAQLFRFSFLAAGFSKQSIGNRVKNHGLARSGRPADEENRLFIHLLKIYHFRAGKRAKGRHGQFNRFHCRFFLRFPASAAKLPAPAARRSPLHKTRKITTKYPSG